MFGNRLVASYGAASIGAAAALLAVACLAVPFAPAASAAECPNEVIRKEQSATSLPNCRAYEQVTPVGKDNGEPFIGESVPFKPAAALAAFDGERLAWESEDAGLSGPEASSASMQYLSSRGPGGWTTEPTVPPQSPITGIACARMPGIVGWSRNLTRGVLADGAHQEYSKRFAPGAGKEAFFGEKTGCGHAEPALTEADGGQIKEPPGFQNLFLRDSETGFYQLVDVTPDTAPHPTPRENSKEEQQYFPSSYLAGAANLSTVVFEDELPLSREAEQLTQLGEPQQKEFDEACASAPKGRACWESHDDLYVWSEGQQPAVRLVTILPGGEPVEGALAGATRNTYSEPLPSGQAREVPFNIADYRHAVSEDGSRIFFESDGDLYVRENASQPQSTVAPGSVAVNGEQCMEATKACTIQLDASQGGGGGGGGRWLGASADGSRVFFSDEQDLTATATASLGEPDLYEYDFEAPQGKRLTDLTANAAEPAGVQGMSGVSEDGAYVYFVAQGDLTGSQQNSDRAGALRPATGTGMTVGPAERFVFLTEGSAQVAVRPATYTKQGVFRVGDEVFGPGIPSGTTVVACSPSCVFTETELTLSEPATESTYESTLNSSGGDEVTGVTATSGAFAVGMAITGGGIPAGTTITAVEGETLTLSKRATESGETALAATAANLYLSHEGELTFVATLSANDLCDWTSSTGCNVEDPTVPAESGLTARVSGDGRYLAFNSYKQLTAYENVGSVCAPLTFSGYGPGSCEEIYLYEAEGNKVACVSCNPAGVPSGHGAAIDWPARGPGEARNTYPQRNLSESGQVFFETAEALLPQQDTNGVRDVYEYEGGVLHLVSSGTSPKRSYFLGASADGSDVFFMTAQKLVGRDSDSVYDIYDARVEGGFAEPPTPVFCESEQCKDAARTTVFSTPSSAAFVGSGDIAHANGHRTPGHKKRGKHSRKTRLRRALRQCAHRYQHTRQKRRECDRRARGRLGNVKVSPSHRHSHRRHQAGSQPGHRQRGGRR